MNLREGYSVDNIIYNPPPDTSKLLFMNPLNVTNQADVPNVLRNSNFNAYTVLQNANNFTTALQQSNTDGSLIFLTPRGNNQTVLKALEPSSSNIENNYTLTTNDDNNFNLDKNDSINSQSSTLLSVGKQSESSQQDDNILNSNSKENSHLSNYIYQVLSSSGEGTFMIDCYNFESVPENKENLLDKKKRTYFDKYQITKLIIYHEVHRTSSYQITHERFEYLAKCTIELFPTLLKESFYSTCEKGKNASGHFPAYLSKLREKAIAINKCKKTTNLKRKTISEESPGLSEDLIELQKPVTFIDEEYKKKWQAVSIQEKQEYFSHNSVKAVFETFPNLLNPSGYTLIQSDFCSIFNKPIDLFVKNWPNVVLKILKLAAKKKIKDKEIKQILNENSECLTEEANKDSREILAIVLLPFLFKKITKQTIKSKTGKSWNPEKSQVLQTFVHHIKETDKINDLLVNYRTSLTNFHNEHKMSVENYVVFNGPSINRIISAYVVLPHHTYQVTSPLLAVDLCFQASKVFQTPFSNICSHVWRFIEREVYNFPISKSCCSVNGLIEKLNTA